jgi:3-dehydrosphinganine reductase
MPAVQDKCVLITGGSKGIGRAIAREFAKRGAHPFLVARGRDALEETQRELQRDFPRVRTGICCADVGRADDAERAVAAMLTEMESIDGIVNNAGIAEPRYFDDTEVAVFERTMQVDFLGAVYFTKAAYPHLRPGSFIAFTSSVAGYIGTFGYTSYCPAKFAMLGFAEALDQECRQRDIHVCVLCPPDTQTPGLDAENKTKPFETAWLSRTARLMSADDVARKFVRGLERDRFLIPGNGASALLYRLKGLAPGLSRRIMHVLVRRAQREKARAQHSG